MPPPQSDDDRALAALLTSVLAAILEQLQYASWHGFVIAEPDAPDVKRARLVHVARLRVQKTQREYNVAAHLFETVNAKTAPHDHRFPLAVFPFAVAANADDILYEMDWTDTRSGATSVVPVRSGDVWAIATAQAVTHTVHSRAPHASIVLSDVTDAPTRDDRLASAPLAPAEITRVREVVRASLARALKLEVAR